MRNALFEQLVLTGQSALLPGLPRLLREANLLHHLHHLDFLPLLRA